MNLSGGQQQRVNLARAVYRALMGAADIVLMYVGSTNLYRHTTKNPSPCPAPKPKPQTYTQNINNNRDDVLSAVDAHVGEHIFRDCIADPGALAGRTRVLVTHQVALTLPQADYVVIMDKHGGILEQGSREALQVNIYTHMHVMMLSGGGS